MDGIRNACLQDVYKRQVYGCETEGGKAVAFLLHHPSMYAEYNVPHWAVAAEEFEPSFSGNYIRFRKAGTLRQAATADALVMSRIYADSWKVAFRGDVPDVYKRQAETHVHQQG